MVTDVKIMFVTTNGGFTTRVECAELPAEPYLCADGSIEWIVSLPGDHTVSVWTFWSEFGQKLLEPCQGIRRRMMTFNVEISFGKVKPLGIVFGPNFVHCYPTLEECHGAQAKASA